LSKLIRKPPNKVAFADLKIPNMKSAKQSETPVFAQALHYIRQRTTTKIVMPGKAKKRENTFSKSRDTREDRGTRQGKTMNGSRTQSHGH
jgi:hypothetical protein